MALLAPFMGAVLISPSASVSWLVGGYPRQPPLVLMDAAPSAIPKTSELSLLAEALAPGAPWVQWQQQRPLDSPPLLPLQKGHPLEDLLVSE